MHRTAPIDPAAFLASIDDAWAGLVAHVGPYRLEPHLGREPYEALVRAVAGQQLHAKAADAILGRLLARHPDTPFPTPEALLDMPEEEKRACGFSSSKVAAIRGIAEAAREGIVPSRLDAERMSDEALVERLTTLRGVGRWTVEMFLIFTLGRPDVWPVGDLAVRAGYARLQGVDASPTPRQLDRIGAAFAPYRTAAAWYLWRVPPR